MNERVMDDRHLRSDTGRREQEASRLPASPNGVERGHVATQPTYETYVVAVPDLAGRLVAKRLDAPFYHAKAGSGFGVCDVVFGWGLGHEEWEGFESVGWDRGYGDLVAVPDQTTLRRLDWWPSTALLMADAYSPDGQLIPVAPRQILTTQIDHAADMGFVPVVASELEFTVLNESAQSMAAKGYTGLTPHGHKLQPELLESLGYDEPMFRTMRDNLRRSAIPVESVKAEYSVGQFELVMSAADAMRAADNHAVFKLGVREICRAHGLEATFMAKWHDEHAGSSCHVHVSLSDLEGANLFAVGDESLMRHFIGGLMRYGPEVFVLWAPYHNSYKRLQPGTFAPSNFTWGTDNRTTALRVCGTGSARHLENRIPGGDINPYLAYAALLACGLAGIEGKIEPGEVTRGNAYGESEAALVPSGLDDALARFAASSFARQSFGSPVVDHLVNFYAKEADAARVAVTDWDRRRLLDI